MTNPPRLYDTAVIGGGLAGLALAIQLSKKGHLVALFERETYPFHKVCGEYISLESRSFLGSLGIPLDEWALPAISRVAISSPNGNLLRQTLPLGGFGISRFKLDAALAEKARCAGAHLYENTKVTGVEFDGRLFHIASSRGPFLAKTVCASYGKRSNLDVKWKRPFIQKSKRKNYIAVKYHVQGNFPEDEIALHNFPGGYCGLSKIEEDRYCLCYLTRAVNLKKCNQSIAEMENLVLKKNPRLREIFGQSQFVFHEPLTISQISFAKKTQVENHILFVGDAAGMITPLCGNGMSMALHAAKIAADNLDLFLRGACSRDELESGYTKQWNDLFANRLRIGRLLQVFFGHPFLSRILIGLLKPFPGIVRRLIKKTHGDSF
ncbi:MAG TPA: NAD(P)-binding protein [Puia sp.]|nr:NAD(P)-binding protein [Puia sp.]